MATSTVTVNRASMRSRAQLIGGCLSVVLALGLAGCGGNSDGSNAPPPAPAPAGIGPSGGTVNGPNGASLTVPAGALATTVDLRIVEIGAANLPAGVERVSAIYSLLPHGTNLTAPATLTVPFQPGQVPAGRNVELLKTTDAARAIWASVNGATNAASVTAGISTLSDAIVSLVPTLPGITTQPVDLTVAVDASATFQITAQANGGGLLNYQWQRNGSPINGATSVNYVFTATAADDGARFSVEVRNGVGSVVSASATLTVTGTQADAWTTLGSTVLADEPVRLGGLAVAGDGRVAVAYVAGSSGTAGLVGELRVSEWDKGDWTQLGLPLNLTAMDGPSLSNRSIAYDNAGRPVVAWHQRFTSELIVQRWNPTTTQWQRLGESGEPLYSHGAVTVPPQIAVDPISGNPIVVITSGPHVTVREWNGTAWLPGGSTSVAISLAGAVLMVTNQGGRQLGITYGDDPGGTQLLTHLRGPDGSGEYTTAFTGPITAPIDASRYHMDLATDGINAYALIGHSSAGPMLVRRWTGVAWETVGGDLGIRDGSKQLRVLPFAMPFIAYQQQGANALQRIDGLWWDGGGWNSVVSPNLATLDVVGFALAIGPNGEPHVAIAQRDPANPTHQSACGSRGCELVVRLAVPVTLSVVVDGPAGSGSVDVAGQTCGAVGTCDLSLPTAATITLDAAPAAGFSLQSWAGCDAVVASRCTVLVDETQTVTATFQ
jgi:hypothetical protein